MHNFTKRNEEMKKIKLIIYLCVMILSFSSAFADVKPEWLSCKEDADCVVLYGECSDHVVNKKNKTEAHDYYSAIDALKDCMRIGGVVDYQVSCVDMKCVASPKQAIGK